MDQQPWNGHNGDTRSNRAGNVGEQETLDSRVLYEIPHYRLRVQKHAGIGYSSNLFLAMQGRRFRGFGEEPLSFISITGDIVSIQSLEDLLKTVSNPVDLLRNSQTGPYVYPVVPPEYTNWRDEQRAWQ